MSRQSLTLDDRLYGYLLDVSLREPELFRRLREETGRMPMARMQIAPEQGQFLALLVEILNARRVLEIGTFTGYSALWMASAVREGGTITCCDISEEWTGIAQRYWKEAGVADRIDLRLAPALETLDALITGGEREAFDLAFIDADKENYVAYYERCLSLLRPGGLVAVDNTLWSGSVADPGDQGVDTQAIRRFNLQLHEDERVTLSLLPLGDGLTLARKR